MKEKEIPVVGPISFPDAVPDNEIMKLIGYAEACDEYGIWWHGRRTIGAMSTPVKEAIMKRVTVIIAAYGGYKGSDLVF